MIKKINLIAWDREGDHEANFKPIKGSVPPSATLAWRTEAPCRWEGCRSLVGLFLSVFFKMLTRRLHLEVTVKSSPPYPHPGGASSDGRGMRRVVCSANLLGVSRRFSWSLVWFKTKLFISTDFILGNGCCSDGLVLCGLARHFFRLSTATSSSRTSFCLAPMMMMEGRGQRRVFGSCLW
jgi:hypothetical protein